MQTQTFVRFTEIRSDTDRDNAEAYLIQLNQAPDAHEHLDEINALGELIENYEIDNGHTPDAPTSLRDILEVEMFKRRIKQRGMAELLEIHETRLSELLKGKRKMTIDVARNLYSKLNIDPATILTLEG